jgi:hypothetical protein
MATFNFMIILGEFQPETDEQTTSYYQFYQSMIKVPYLGSSIPRLLPSLILIFSLVFAGLSVFKLKNRALAAFKQVSQNEQELRITMKADKQNNKDDDGSAALDPNQ